MAKIKCPACGRKRMTELSDCLPCPGPWDSVKRLSIGGCEDVSLMLPHLQKRFEDRKSKAHENFYRWLEQKKKEKRNESASF